MRTRDLMILRTTRWIVAFIIAAATISIGCARHQERRPVTGLVPIVDDDSLVHAFDTEMQTRLIDRLELDSFLRDRHIQIELENGTVNVSGQVCTSLERERVSELLRGVPGVIDVANHLDVRPPA